MYISGGTVADYVVAFARTNGTPGPKGFSAFIVTTDTPGFKVAGQDRKMGVRGVPTADIVLRRLPRAAREPDRRRGPGFNHAMVTLNSCRPVVGARGLGLAEGCLSYSLEFARKREAFGKPIADLAGDPVHVRRHGDPDRSRAHARLPGGVARRPGSVPARDAAYLSIAKVRDGVAETVSRDAMQVLGAQGYMMDHPIERHYRDARQLMIVEGTARSSASSSPARCSSASSGTGDA